VSRIDTKEAPAASDHQTDAPPEGTPAADIDTDTDTRASDDPGEGTRRGGIQLWHALLAGLIVAFVAVCSALGYTLYQQSELHRMQNEAVDTTRGYLSAMSSFDYQNLDANKATVTAGSTPEFGRKYDEMVAALRDIVTAGKGVATATAKHVAVESLDEHTATLIAFVDQQVTNVTAPAGNKQRYRMLVSLQRSGDRWLVGNVETL